VEGCGPDFLLVQQIICSQFVRERFDPLILRALRPSAHQERDDNRRKHGWPAQCTRLANLCLQSEFVSQTAHVFNNDRADCVDLVRGERVIRRADGEAEGHTLRFRGLRELP
jgi:hypothetical protein